MVDTRSVVTEWLLHVGIHSLTKELAYVSDTRGLEALFRWCEYSI